MKSYLGLIFMAFMTLSVFIQGSTAGGLTVASYCPYRWTRRGNTIYCFDVRTSHKSWHNARTDCVNSQGYLARLKSSEINNYAKNMIPNSGCGSTESNAWFGLNDIDQNGNFKYTDGVSKGSYSNWASGEPDNKYSGTNGPADCVIIRKNSNRWLDMKCAQTKCYICQREVRTKVKEVWVVGPSGDGRQVLDGSETTCIKMTKADETRPCEASYIYVRVSDAAATTFNIRLRTAVTAGVNTTALPECAGCGAGRGITLKMQQQTLVSDVSSDAARFSGYYVTCVETSENNWRCECLEPPCDLLQVIVAAPLSYTTNICEIDFPNY